MRCQTPMALLVVALGLLAAPAAVQAAGDAVAGAAVYDKYCSQCHGAQGAADGPAAEFVLPRPRVFKDNSSYKFRTTPSGELPTDQDLVNIIVRGIPGTSMPAFDRLSESERWDVVAHLKTLAADFSDPVYVATAVAMPELLSPSPLKSTAASIERGRAVYEENKCAQCHGESGRGNGVSWPDLKDDWDNAILPANLTAPEYFRGGSQPFDIFRAVTSGFNGTPMPSYGDAISVEDRWNLVNYVLSLAAPGHGEKHEVVVARRLDTLPADAADAAWSDCPPARFRTLSNIIEPPRLYWPSVEFIIVRAAYDDTDLMLRVEWDDRSQSTGTDVTTVYQDRDGAIHAGTQHPDQFAVQFPAKTKDVRRRPYFLLGDSKRAASLWSWSSAQPEALVEQVAKGVTAIAPQDAASQALSGSVTYDDGRYTLLVRRKLTTDDVKNDPQFVPAGFVPIAFNVWDGTRGEVGARRALTTWYWLYLEPQATSKPLLALAVAFAATFGLLVILVIVSRRRAARAPRAPDPAPAAA